MGYVVDERLVGLYEEELNALLEAAEGGEDEVLFHCDEPHTLWWDLRNAMHTAYVLELQGGRWASLKRAVRLSQGPRCLVARVNRRRVKTNISSNVEKALVKHALKDPSSMGLHEVETEYNDEEGNPISKEEWEERYGKK